MGILKKCWQRGIEPFLFFDELQAHRIDREPLTESDQLFIRTNKIEIILEIRNIAEGERINFDKFLEDRKVGGTI